MLLEYICFKRVTSSLFPKTLAELRAYVRKKIPNLGGCQCYREETRNRRIIMQLNYWGLHDLSRLILQVNSRI